MGELADALKQWLLSPYTLELAVVLVGAFPAWLAPKAWAKTRAYR